LKEKNLDSELLDLKEKNREIEEQVNRKKEIVRSLKFKAEKNIQQLSDFYLNILN
jgi:hypothetical protein